MPGLSAEEWLAETLFDPQASQSRPIFKIRNPEIIELLNIEKNKESLYSFNKLSKALDQILDQLNNIKDKPEEDRELIEKQIWNLYLKTLSYFQLNRSLFMIQPLFSLKSSPLSKKLGLEAGKKYSYLEMLKFQRDIDREIGQFKKMDFKKSSKEERELILLSYKINILAQNEDNSIFKIIPPQWDEDRDLWLSPWELIHKGRGSPLSALYMDSWKDLERAYHKGRGWGPAGETAYRQAIKFSTNFSSPFRLFLEKMLNDIRFFQKSLTLYLMAFLSLILSFVFWKKPLYKISFIALAGGGLLHLIGSLFRMIIMKRPPVTNLYESIIFVGLIFVGLALLMEKRDSPRQKSSQKGLGLFIGSLAGAVLHFIALKHKGAESLSLLVPVLNSNFWLATHVTCISIGYAGAIFFSLIGHVYIFYEGFKKWSGFRKKEIRDPLRIKLQSQMRGAIFFALFFCLSGTILGGIWADQSWGRFWGWDPKENGALAIVIWLLVLIHGQLAGILKNKGLAIGAILTNVIVALSWFGVNLLSLGLHSYGFTEGVFWGLMTFCGGEMLLALFASIFLISRP